MSYKGKRTYQPSKTKRTRTFGFRARMATTVSDEKKPF